MKSIILNLLAFGSLISSVLVITSNNPVISVLFLISVFINAAGYLIILGIGFIGISYIIIYIGAITVLFLFVIMLLNIRISELVETKSQYTQSLPLAVIIGLILYIIIFTIVPFSTNDVSFINHMLSIFTLINTYLTNTSFISADFNSVYSSINPIIYDTTFNSYLHIEALGNIIYTFAAIWLIITSLILLLAMIAPIFLSK